MNLLIKRPGKRILSFRGIPDSYFSSSSFQQGIYSSSFLVTAFSCRSCSFFRLSLPLHSLFLWQKEIAGKRISSGCSVYHLHFLRWTIHSFSIHHTGAAFLSPNSNKSAFGCFPLSLALFHASSPFFFSSHSCAATSFEEKLSQGASSGFFFKKGDGFRTIFNSFFPRLRDNLCSYIDLCLSIRISSA